MTDDLEELPLKYRIVLAIKHPNLDPATISVELGMEPSNSWVAGDERKTPMGTRLPGTNPSSFWTASEEALGDRFFFKSVVDLVRRLEKSADFISNIADTGGVTSVIIQLSGQANIGDTMGSEELLRLAKPKMQLGVEVFPRMN